MPYRPVHHVLDIVLILQSRLAGLRQSHWFGETVVMMVVLSGSLVVSSFQVRRRALDLARRRHGLWKGDFEDEAAFETRDKLVAPSGWALVTCVVPEASTFL
jgi:hypothetical protein